jgi:magnesium transporter
VRVLTEIDRDQITELVARDEFFWLDLTGSLDHGLTDILGVEPPPSHEPGTRRRQYAYHGRYAVLVYKGADVVDDRVDPFDVIVYVSGSYVVTVHERRVEELDRLRARFDHRDAGDEQLAVARVLDAITDSFVSVLTVLDERIVLLEDAVIEQPRGDQLNDVAVLQRELFALRRAVNPQRDLIQRVRDEIADLPGLEPGNKDYLHEVADYLNRISEQIDHYAGLLTNATDIYLSRVSNQLNDVMKRLTIVATVFLPLTFVTGFFGQNFAWLVEHVDTLTTFLVWGMGGLVAAIVAMALLFLRGGYL